MRGVLPPRNWTRTAPWVNDGAEGWRRELIAAVIAF